MPVRWNGRCLHCGTRYPAAAARCTGCGVRLFHHAGFIPTAEIARVMLPNVIISTRHFGRLENLAHIQLETSYPVAELLLAELERATGCPPDAVGRDVVTMNSRIIFKTNLYTEYRSATIVYPEEYYPLGGQLSVMEPLGAAVLGIRAGERMPYTNLQGVRFSVTVKEVVYQPAH